MLFLLWIKDNWKIVILLGLIIGEYFFVGNMKDNEWEAKTLKKDNVELAQAATRIKTLEEEARAKESNSAKVVNAISAKYEKDKQNVKTKTDKLIADITAGTISLSDPTGKTMYPNGSGSGETGSSTSECNGGTSSKLSRETSVFLLNIAGEADEVTKQLTSCQEIVKKDRE